MAKSLRSSRNKTNNSKLRSKVFGPVEDARKERLSAKLLELASKPKPNQKTSGDMDVDEEESKQLDQNQEDLVGGLIPDEDGNVGMEDTTASTTKKKPPSITSKRIQKRSRGKAAASMVFPVYKRGQRVGPRLSARQRKQSLKP